MEGTDTGLITGRRIQRKGSGMKKRLKEHGILTELILVMVLLICTFHMNAFAEQQDGQVAEQAIERAVEQVVICKPLIRVDYRGATDQVPVIYLDGEQLAAQNSPVRIGDSDIGIEYYVLLDISGSLGYERFEDIKNSLQQFVSELRGNDRLVLYTFGDSVNLVLSGDEDKESAIQTIAALENGDMNTALFEALTDAASEIEEASEDGMHRLIICISDGEDFADNTKDTQTVSDSISSKGIPVYTIAVEKKSETEEEARKNRSSLSAVATNTGGIPWTVDQLQDGIGSIAENSVLNGLHIIQDTVLNTNHMELSAPSNKISMKIEDLVLRFPDGKELTKKVLVSRNIADNQAPSVTDVTVVSENEIRITFSEVVDGAEKAENYKLTGDRAVAVSQVVLEDSSTHTYSLILGDDLKNGTYSLQIQNVTDDSQEKNPLELYSEPQPLIVASLPEETESEDLISPSVEDITVINENEIQVTYSESVDGAERPENYRLIGDKTIAVTQVIADDSSAHTYSLILGNDLKNGGYTLQIQNVTDSSKEKNPLEFYSEPQPLIVEGLPEETEPETEPKDLIAPTVEDIAVISENELRITFSEAVDGAERAENYKLSGERTVAISQVIAEDPSAHTYSLILGDDLKNGSYTLQIQNVTDDSQEKNPLELYSEPQPLSVAGLPEETEPETEPKDMTAPIVTEITASEPDGFEITFSEAVAGAEINGNYSVSLDGKDVAVVQAKALDDDGTRFKIVLADNLVNGDYTINMSHITDQSGQENLLEETAWSAKVQGVKHKTDTMGMLLKWWPIILTVIVLILLLVMVLNSRRIKKNKVTLIEGVAVEKDHVNKKVQVNIGDSTKTREVEIEIDNGTEAPKRIPYTIRGSLTVGRSKEDCDIFCNDTIMSRKHFRIISEEDGNFYVEDLGSKNGTHVNGNTISQKTLLHSGDEIRAGKMHFRVKWTT